MCRSLLTISVLLGSIFGALAADPVAVPDGKFADLKVPAPKGTSVVWRVYPPPVQRAPDLAPGRIIFVGKAGQTYTATAITIDFGAQTTAEEDFQVVFGGAAAPPPPGKDKEPDRPPPAPPLYFLVVRADGPASPAFTKAMADPAWDELRKAGHKVKDKTAAEALALGVAVPPGELPAVVTLVVAAGGKESTLARGPVPLPATGAGILDLPKGVR